jgi:predicted nuclease of predicted toxin-antitoxin system
MLRLLADENLDHDIVRGVLRRKPMLDIVDARAVGLAAADDIHVLEWAAREQRIVLTHDVNTMPSFAIQRMKEDKAMAGLFVAHQERTPLSTLIEDILLLDECTETTEWAQHILYLPLR